MVTQGNPNQIVSRAQAKRGQSQEGLVVTQKQLDKQQDKLRRLQKMGLKTRRGMLKAIAKMREDLEPLGYELIQDAPDSWILEKEDKGANVQSHGDNGGNDFNFIYLPQSTKIQKKSGVLPPPLNYEQYQVWQENFPSQRLDDGTKPTCMIIATSDIKRVWSLGELYALYHNDSYKVWHESICYSCDSASKLFYGNGLIELQGSALLHVFLRTIGAGLSRMVAWMSHSAKRTLLDFPPGAYLQKTQPESITSWQKLWETFGASLDLQQQAQDPEGNRAYINHCYAEDFKLLCRMMPDLPMTLERYAAALAKIDKDKS